MDYFKDIKIGNLVLQGNIILAPCSGVTDLPFRSLVKKMGASLVISEMIASQAMIRETNRTLKMAELSSEERPVAVQLAGCEPSVMTEAAKLIADLGADIVDINMGCPAKKIVNGYAGSALMKDLQLAQKIIQAVVNAVKIPVTLKMRTGWDSNSLNAPTLAKIAEDYGIQMITVHGRTRCQLYSGKSDWQFVGKVKDSINIPVIVNGDIVNEENAVESMKISGADGVMIGRGTYGKPWFLQLIKHFFQTGQKLASPSIVAQKDIVKNHFKAIIQHHGDTIGSRMARKHIAWYSRGLKNSNEFRVKVNQLTETKEILTCIDDFYNSNIDLAENFNIT